MKLYGSIASPYARRLRIWLQGKEYEFEIVDVFNADDRAKLVKDNPTLKIPMLEDEKNVILDSGLIFQYLSEKYQTTALTWARRNLLLNIDSVNDSLVNMFVLERSDIDTSEDKLYYNIQRDRAHNIFTFLNEQAAQGEFKTWDYVSISLYCLLDWSDFRERFDFSHHPHLHAFWKDSASQPGVKETDPRD